MRFVILFVDSLPDHYKGASSQAIKLSVQCPVQSIQNIFKIPTATISLNLEPNEPKLLPTDKNVPKIHQSQRHGVPSRLLSLVSQSPTYFEISYL